METLTFWNVFMDLGGRTLLTLLLITIILLLILEIYGNVKNRKYRSSVSRSNTKWTDSGFKRRSKFDGMETLEINPQRLSPRLNTQQTRHVSTHQGIPVNERYEFTRDDGVVVDIKSGTIERVRLGETELSETADRKESLSHSHVV